ncbi:lipopolysaccharide-binding protein [Klebsormidium nitens]|uniref:Lipopolysaccharide-binding protein n=1 Tax=Klebsormidium nitens TaxID=105231 RepID=A0A1Y1ISD2_KLENI|nr:lipopolysaccharide-binding protein [Klebsormidium nitens]|eukprot:GAQ91078.1 lipopolysaccharide-binding protein [Klebsormidium nitens]
MTGHMARAFLSAFFLVLCISCLATIGATISAPHLVLDLPLHQDEFRSVASAAAPRPPALAGMQASLSSEGLNYVKEVLVQQILQQQLPLVVPDLRVRERSPIGHVDVVLSHIVLPNMSVPEAHIDLEPAGAVITIFAAGVTANVSLSWAYKVAAQYWPWPMGDAGRGHIEIEGLQTGVSFRLKQAGGGVLLEVVQTGTFIEALHVHLSGGQSWLYNWFIQVLGGKIRAALESAVGGGVAKGVAKLDKFLQTLPQRIPVDQFAAIDATLLRDPLVESASLSFPLSGQFVPTAGHPPPFTPAPLPFPALCGAERPHAVATVSAAVLNSAGAVYFAAGQLTWPVDELPAGSPVQLNTRSWRFLLPRLYLQYPDAAMALNISFTAAPVVTLDPDGVAVAAQAAMEMQVLDQAGARQGVAAIGISATFQGAAYVRGNNVTGAVHLDSLQLALLWSHIGDFHMGLIQASVRSVVSLVVLPQVNRRLATGFPLPVVPGVRLRNSSLCYAPDSLIVCTDVEYRDGQEGQREEEGAGERTAGAGGTRGWGSWRRWIP